MDQETQHPCHATNMLPQNWEVSINESNYKQMIMRDLIDGFPLPFLKVIYFWPMRGQGPGHMITLSQWDGGHWPDLTNKSLGSETSINIVLDPDLWCWNFLVCTRVNLDTTHNTIYWLLSVRPILSWVAHWCNLADLSSMHTHYTQGWRGIFLFDLIKVSTGITWHQQVKLRKRGLMENRSCWVSLKLREEIRLLRCRSAPSWQTSL